MYALIENNEIKEIFSNIRALKINDIQYPKNIFTVWSESELNNVGLYTVVFDNSNKKDYSCYTNTDVSYAFADGKVTASYGAATPKELDDVKSKKKALITLQASNLLTPTDWYIIKAVDVESYSAPANIITYRANIRTASNDMETIIDNASDVDALATLYQYVNTGTEEIPVMERPLGEFPILEV